MAPTTPPDDGTEELDLVLDASASHALKGAGGSEFIAWFQDVVPILAPHFVAAIEGGEEDRRAILQALGRLLWNRMPLPDNRFRPRPLPRPERNAACPCGSGRKYKHCCARVEEIGDPFEQVSLLKYVLQQYSRARLKNLPVDELNVDELGYIGNEWIREGRAADAAVLLEQVFADPGRLGARAEYAFDVLADCYDALNHPKKKQALIDRCLETHDKTLRSAALHRRITMLADRGERAEAWRLFGEAQRLQPDNPMLATLELTMLLNEGNRERLRERGQFWIARLARDRDHDFGDRISHIRELIANPDEIAFKYESNDRPGLQKLRALIAAMPPPACYYDVQRDEHDACLLPSLDARKLVAAWYASVAATLPGLSGFSEEEAEPLENLASGVDWLEAHPLAWQCFDILDVLARGLAWAGVMGADELLQIPLMERGCTLLRLALTNNGSEGCALPWSFVENRPALQLVAALAWARRKQRRLGEARELAQWMVSTLNPHDNHGLREDLVQMCLEQDDAQAALGVCERFPNDILATTLFGRPLALYRLGRREEAASALLDAARLRPHVLPMLFATKPRRPRGDPDHIRIGGKDEAWIYREDNLGLWTSGDALEWARGIAQRTRR
ncbi:MAG: SEC-C domain-containing protein [Casimicrobiaceae bacterium]